MRCTLVPAGNALIAFIERGGVIHQDTSIERKWRYLSRARFYSKEDVKALLENAGFLMTGIDARTGFCVFTAEGI
ncbi:MAG TPA: hypothetical protein PK069_09150 [Methanolinea sp.]|nr:hypothetical protein [Methanolinea sp.]HQK56507.1 hypothetical protein [Methanolinea sp.]